jgi:dynein heavy chain
MTRYGLIAIMFMFVCIFSLLQVVRHLTKLFDSMAKLKFEKLPVEHGDSESQENRKAELKLATGMWSKDGEYVNLSSPCDCSGQVIIH